MRKKAGFSDGYSLVELMIAMAIAAIMFSGIYLVNLETMKILQMARDETRAIQAAQYELEKIRSYSWVTINNMPEDSGFTDADNAVLAQLNGGWGSIKKTAYSEAGIEEPMVAVTVTVNWTTPSGDSDAVTLTSCMTKKGSIQ